MCERFHVLPHAGGLLHQEDGHLKRMEKVILAQFAADELEEKKEEARRNAKAKAEKLGGS